MCSNLLSSGGIGQYATTLVILLTYYDAVVILGKNINKKNVKQLYLATKIKSEFLTKVSINQKL